MSGYSFGRDGWMPDDRPCFECLRPEHECVCGPADMDECERATEDELFQDAVADGVLLVGFGRLASGE